MGFVSFLAPLCHMQLIMDSHQRAYKERRDTRASAYGESVTSGDGGMPSSGEVYNMCQYA